MTVIQPNSVAGINSITVQSGNSLAIHKSNGELLRTITGTTGVSTFSSISVGTAYTDNSAAKSINIGVGASISQHDAKTLTFGTAGDPRITIDASGNFNVGSAATIKAGGNATFSGIVTASAFKGDGSGLSGITQTTINGNTDSRVITATGTANTLQGEEKLTFNGSVLHLNSQSGGLPRIRLQHTGSGNDIFELSSGISGVSNGGFSIKDIDEGVDRLTILSNGDVGINTSVINRVDSGRPVVQFDYGGNDGSQGLEVRLSNSTLNGNAATDNAAITYIGQNLGFNNRENGVITFRNNGSERLRITAAGRIGIGTDDPDHTFEVTQAGSSVATSRSGNNAQLLFKSNNVGQAAQIDVSESSGGGVFIFKNKNTSGTLTESFRVNTDQSVSIGNYAANSAKLNLNQDGTHITCRSPSTGGYYSIYFRSANTNVGNIFFNSGGTQFNTSSDYRRKENVVGITSAITRLKTLIPKRFNFITESGVTRDGFLAHEVTTVPEAITGTKDAVSTTADVTAGISTYVGEPIYQTIDQSKLVPLLTAALQEAVTKIETLETKVAALEGG